MIGHHFPASAFTSAPSGDPQIGAAGCLAMLWGISCLSRSSGCRRSGNVPGCLATWNRGGVSSQLVLKSALGFPKDCAKFSGGVKIPVGVDAKKVSNVGSARLTHRASFGNGLNRAEYLKRPAV
jgi:hypothetical protein